MPDRFDYVIIGAGSAGCLLANRLSADPSKKVLLLEAGGKNNSMIVSMPTGMVSVLTGQNDYNWGFTTDPIPGFNGRTLYQARGRGWGGSSSINGMIFVRGNAGDFDGWAQTGLPGWSYDDVLPYFRSLEDAQDGDEGFHGKGGPLFVSRNHSDLTSHQAFLDAATEAGFPLTSDFNGATQDGFGHYQINLRNGVRAGALASFLRPALSRPNLVTRNEAHVTRIVLDQGRAIGVEFASARGAPREMVHVDGEVILSAGAFQSPQILQLSGLGDPEQLRELGITTTVALPGVGRNLQDHVDISVNYRSKLPLLHSITKGWRKIPIGLKYLMGKKGLAAQSAVQVGGFIKSRPDLAYPDIQFGYIPGVMVNHGEKGLAPFDGYTINLVPLRPESRGEVMIASSDPFAPPRLVPNFLSTPGDMQTMRIAIRAAQMIGNQPALAPWRAEEIEPAKASDSDEVLDHWIRNNAATVFHPVGTCRMGRDDDAMAVTDARLRVRGVRGLRVVDASVMPNITSGNTNAPVYMIAEKASQMILADARG